MPQATAIAVTCFIRFASENLTDSFIRFVLEKSARVGNLAEQLSGNQLLARTWLIRASSADGRIVHAGAHTIFIGLVRVVT